MKTRFALILFACLVLGACGGNSDGSDQAIELQSAIDAANAKEAEARSLASVSPCSSDQQCSTLSFIPPTGACSCQATVPYSLVAANASAAGAAASEQNALAARARTLSTEQHLQCPCPAPVHSICMASICQLSL
jgi:hypothetical protein